MDKLTGREKLTARSKLTDRNKKSAREANPTQANQAVAMNAPVANVNIHKQTSSIKMEDESFEESEEGEAELESGGGPMDVDARATEHENNA
mmetsp:Transcript_24266/g.37425  ORF Transcript_24266/g.37425 Transcript_24266/m.37425 type:complete len:92 (+) Transcript_24266:3021-3296(+)